MQSQVLTDTNLLIRCFVFQVLLSCEAAELLSERVVGRGEFTVHGQCRLHAQDRTPIPDALPQACASRSELLSTELCSSEMFENVLRGLLPGLNVAHRKPTIKLVNGLVLMAVQVEGVNGLKRVQTRLEQCCRIAHDHGGALLHTTRTRWVTTQIGRSPPGLCVVFVFGYPSGGSKADNMAHAWRAAFELSTKLADAMLVSRWVCPAGFGVAEFDRPA